MNSQNYKEINSLYQQILHRDVDPSGYETYTSLLRSGKLSIADIAQILRESDEFRSLVLKKHIPHNFLYSPINRSGVDAVGTKKKSGENHGLVVATIVSKDGISMARVTAKSFLKYHPDIPFVTLLADEVDGWLQPANEPFQLVEMKDIGIPDLQRFRFQYTKQETSYAATPFFLEYLLNDGFSNVLFLKQETLVVNKLDPLFEALRQAPLILTPHLLVPLPDLKNVQNELNVLRAGIFNGGVVGVSKTNESYSFLRWWQERTYHDCFRLVDDGLHYEQRWLDFAPSFVKGVHIVRDPGVNIGHWNLHEREIREHDGVFTALGVPCRIIRFSGYDAERPGQVTRYDDRILVKNTGCTEPIFRHYQQQLEISGYHETKQWPYAFDEFDNGVQVPDVVRRIYHDLDTEVTRFKDPLCNTDQSTSFFSWLMQESDYTAGKSLPNLYLSLYESLPELQLRFPDLICQANEFKQWCYTNLASELSIPPEMLATPEFG
jgi:hypothetical protein